MNDKEFKLILYFLCFIFAIFTVAIVFSETKELKTRKLEDELTKIKIEATSRGVAEFVVRPKSYQQSGNGRPLGFKLVNRNYKD